MNVVIEIDGIRHKMVDTSLSPCDHCSLESLCDKGNFEVGLCVDVFEGNGHSRFIIEKNKL